MQSAATLPVQIDWQCARMNDQWMRSSEAAKSALEATSDSSLRVPCYCEENVWRLAYRKVYQQQQTRGTYHVAFVSNPKGCVPMYEQLAADNKRTPVSTCPSLHVVSPAWFVLELTFWHFSFLSTFSFLIHTKRLCGTITYYYLWRRLHQKIQLHRRHT